MNAQSPIVRYTNSFPIEDPYVLAVWLDERGDLRGWYEFNGKTTADATQCAGQGWRVTRDIAASFGVTLDEMRSAIRRFPRPEAP